MVYLSPLTYFEGVNEQYGTKWDRALPAPIKPAVQGPA